MRTSRNLSTLGVSPKERSAFWRSAIRDYYLLAEVELPRDNAAFNASLSDSPFGSVSFSDYRAGPYLARRTDVHVRRDVTENFFCFFPLRGRKWLRQAGRECVMEPGAFTVLWSGAPLETWQTEVFEALIVRFPGSALRARLPDVTQIPCLPRDFDVGMAGLAANFIQSMRGAVSGDAAGVTTELRAQLAEQAADLLAFCFLADQSISLDESSARAGIYRRACQVIDARLFDDGLSPGDVAAELGISQRYLHDVFSKRDQSVAAMILNKRLDAAKRVLGNPLYAARSISHVAYEHGFRSTAHFSIAFKRAFGSTPSAYRSTAAQHNIAESAREHELG
ncbi:MAG: helix-turn-helix domain-containing protein [Pseudomonadota bacterium]